MAIATEPSAGAGAGTAAAPVHAPADRNFKVGLTFAGAVSAGAYSAGVLDFLVEALEEWRASGQDIGHGVVIPVVTGASAGGIVGALGLLEIASGKIDLDTAPLLDRTSPGAVSPRAYVLPSLYNAWVKRIAFSDADGGGLLGGEDLNGTDPIRSLLDAGAIDRVAESMLRDFVEARARQSPPVRPWLADKVHLFLTLTNLRGVPYRVGFAGQGGSDGHEMTVHGDRRHYVWNGLGDTPFTSTWLNFWGDGGTPVEMSMYVDTSGSLTHQGRDFIQTIIGTGAFPVGLAPRWIESRTGEYRRAWMLSSEDASAMSAILPRGWPDADDTDVPYHAVDGGMVDNEPFEIARWTLKVKPDGRNPPERHKADRAVVMIDPFPNISDFDIEETFSEADIAQKRGVLSIARSLLPSMMNQARVKYTDLLRAGRSDVASRFLIAPRRVLGDPHPDLPRAGELPAIHPLATDIYRAFGGFLSEALRRHDYQLGRRNCQKFLRDVFTLDGNNPIMGGSGDSEAGTAVPIVPLHGKARIEVPQPPWPVVDVAEIADFRERVRERADKAVRHGIDTTFASWRKQQLLKKGWMLLGGGVVHAFLVDFEAELVRAGMHGKWRPIVDELHPDHLPDPETAKRNADDREVLNEAIARLYRAEPDLLTARYLAKQIHLVRKNYADREAVDPARVDRLLAPLVQRGLVDSKTHRGGETGYVLGEIPVPLRPSGRLLHLLTSPFSSAGLIDSPD